MSKKAILLILDGWGNGTDDKVSAIAQGNTPFIDSLYLRYPNAQLATHGEAVGLPVGQMGNSEVGHMNLGAGRIVFQELLRIDNACRDGSFAKNTVLLEAFNYAKKHQKKIHLIGLVSDGGVHSSLNHLKHLCDLAKENQIEDVFIHAFTDGRDTDPKSGLGYIKDLESHLEDSTGKIASIVGRYYGMDRDKRWERIKLSYDLLRFGKGKSYTNSIEAVEASYDNNITDEFIEPIVIANNDGVPLARVEEGDVVLCFNFRTDRCREITEVLTQNDYVDHEMETIPLYYVTMTEYDANFRDIKLLFTKENLNNTLGEVIQNQGKKQIRIAETEKYAHVTFFFSGGREKEFEGERRLLVNSPRVATYDLQPEMSAEEVKDLILPEISNESADFICLNFANSDMVGHTGIFDAAKKAVEKVDACVNEIVELALEKDYLILLTADHGNSDYLINPDGSPNTAHSMNLVPFIVIGGDEKLKVDNGRLCDVAPTILYLMNMEIPSEMTGEVLVSSYE